MSKNTLMTSAAKALGKAKFGIKKHSPEILVVTGVVSVVAGAVLACKATTKASVVLKEAKTEINTINACLNDEETAKQYEEATGEVYTPETHKKDLTIAYTQTGLKLVKLYAPAVILGALGITSILASNNILRKRNAALVAAYAVVDKSFKEYRERVIDRFGEAVDKELKYNIQAEQIEVTEVDEKTGKEKKVKKTVNVTKGGPDGYSMYSRIFDEKCYDWDDNADMNKSFLNAQQEYFNRKLQLDGYVFLNDVYKALGFEPSKAGQIVGWCYDPSDPTINSYIDFGLEDIHREKVRDFINGYEKCIILDFNVDGPIYDKFQDYARRV